MDELHARFNLSLKCRYVIIILLSTCFCLLELGIGVISNSVSLAADAFHYIGDIIGFVVSFLILSVRGLFPVLSSADVI
jgi:Co/Zn/Cd efflux system component